MDKLMLIVIIIIYLINLKLNLVQTKNYYNTLNKIKSKYKSNIVSVGKDKRYFSMGCIVIISINQDGIIEDAAILKGISLFARFKTYFEVINQSIYDENFEFNSKALQQAIDFVKQKDKI